MHIISKQGSADNVLTYEHICDTAADMAKIERKYITLGSVCIVLQGESGAMEVYMADSSKEWHDIMIAGSSSSSDAAGLSLYVCTSMEVLNGKPNVSIPLERTLYLVPSGNTSGNLYNEYVYINNDWELFGSASMNLEGYATQAWVSQQGYLTSHQDISGKANSTDLATVATSGSYNDLSNKPSIPTKISDLTDDSGHYTKPAGGIPAADLAETYATQTYVNNALTAADTLPTPNEDGIGLVSINGEWIQQPGYGYSVTEDSFILGNFTSTDFTQENAEYIASIFLTNDLFELLQRMFVDQEEFNVKIDDIVYNSITDNFVYDTFISPAIYLRDPTNNYDIFRLSYGNDAVLFHVPELPTTAKIYGSITTYTTMNKNLLPNINVEAGTGDLSVIMNGSAYNTASGESSVAQGYGTTASGVRSHAEGESTIATGDNAHAEGLGTFASGMASHTEGISTIASIEAQHAQGKYNIDDIRGTYAHIVGNGTADNARSNAYALDWDGNGHFAGDIYVGANPDSTGGEKLAKESDILIESGIGIGSIQSKQFTITIDNEDNIYAQSASGEGAIAFGAGVNASSFAATAIGIYTTASGEGSFAEGDGSKAIGYASHAEGSQGTQAIGFSSHAEGTSSFALGEGAHSEGNFTRAMGIHSHSEGRETVALGDQSHAEGYGETCRGAISSHPSENVYGILLSADVCKGCTVRLLTEDGIQDDQTYTIVSVDYANDQITLNADPFDIDDIILIENNVAIGDASHTEGSFTIAASNSSHSEGDHTIAKGKAQHVQGKYNIEDTSETYAHIVGNGTSSARSNAHTLDWNGNAWYAGKVTAGTVNSPANPTAANDLTTKQYVDNALAAKVVSVGGTTPVITAVADTQYICGEVSTLSFTPSVTGTCDVIFESGATATILTVPNTVKFPEWFDASALEANMAYEINITNGVYGAVMSWVTA